jgi:hypothetical protein
MCPIWVHISCLEAATTSKAGRLITRGSGIQLLRLVSIQKKSKETEY